MSLLLFESFDCFYGGNLSGHNQWSHLGACIPGMAGYGRRGTGGMRLTGSTSLNWAEVDLLSEQSSLIIGFAIYPDSDSTWANRFLSIRNAADGVQFVVEITSTGKIRIKASPTGDVLAESSDGAVTYDIFQYFEIKFTCTGDDTVQVKVNGVDKIPYTDALNLRQSGSGGAQKMRWFAITTAGYSRLDDLYICNLSGPKYNEFLGDVKVDVFWPVADGTYEQFTPTTEDHYDAIDDNGAAAPTHYIEADTVDQKDSFTLSPSGDLPTIHAIEMRNVGRNPDTGVAEGTPFIRMGAVDYEQASFEYGDTIEYDDAILTARPDTGGIWTKALLETIEIGWKFSGAS